LNEWQRLRKTPEKAWLDSRSYTGVTPHHAKKWYEHSHTSTWQRRSCPRNITLYFEEGRLKMKTTVPCKITYSEEDKCWYVESPGFYDGIITNGDTLENAKKMASEAVCGLIETYLDHSIPFSIPPVNNAPDYYAIPLEPGLSFDGRYGS
jgi:predicted RNase H-like HicB family nuclease